MDKIVLALKQRPIQLGRQKLRPITDTEVENSVVDRHMIS